MDVLCLYFFVSSPSLWLLSHFLVMAYIVVASVYFSQYLCSWYFDIHGRHSFRQILFAGQDIIIVVIIIFRCVYGHCSHIVLLVTHIYFWYSWYSSLCPVMIIFWQGYSSSPDISYLLWICTNILGRFYLQFLVGWFFVYEYNIFRHHRCHVGTFIVHCIIFRLDLHGRFTYKLRWHSIVMIISIMSRMLKTEKLRIIRRHEMWFVTRQLFISRHDCLLVRVWWYKSLVIYMFKVEIFYQHCLCMHRHASWYWWNDINSSRNMEILLERKFFRHFITWVTCTESLRPMSLRSA